MLSPIHSRVNIYCTANIRVCNDIGRKLGLPYYVERTARQGLLDFSYRPVTAKGGAEIICGLFELRDMRTIFEEYRDDASANPVSLPEADHLLKPVGKAKVAGYSSDSLRRS